MAVGNMPFPGVSELGFRDGAGHRLQAFADATARDAWVTSIGGTTKLVAGAMCYLTGTNAINIWSGSAWRSVATS